MAVTIKDVATVTGLSIATISKCINGIKIKDENKEKISRAIVELGYKVNYSAQELKTNKSKTIGILIPTFESYFSTKYVSYIEDVLQNYQYSAIICDYNKNEELEKAKLEFLLSKNVDGIIILPYEEFENYTDIIKPLVENEVPFVILDKCFENIDCDCLMLDNIEICYNATRLLIEKGHRRIAVIVGLKSSMTTLERLEGYKKALLEHSIPIDEELIFFGSARYQAKSGKSSIYSMLELEDKPTAVFVTNYEMTLGAVIAVNEININIPEELSLIGFDDLRLSEIFKPKLTIVTQPMKLMGEMTANILLKRIQGDYSDFPIKKRLKGNIKVGKSVKSIK